MHGNLGGPQPVAMKITISLGLISKLLFFPACQPARSTVFGNPTKTAGNQAGPESPCKWVWGGSVTVKAKQIKRSVSNHWATCFSSFVWSQPNVHEFMLPHTYRHCCEKETLGWLWSWWISSLGISCWGLWFAAASMPFLPLIPPKIAGREKGVHTGQEATVPLSTLHIIKAK